MLNTVVTRIIKTNVSAGKLPYFYMLEGGDFFTTECNGHNLRLVKYHENGINRVRAVGFYLSRNPQKSPRHLTQLAC
jgi:hypothetical protein